MVVQQECRFVRRRWAFEGHAEDCQQDVAALERLEPLVETLRAGHGVEVEAGFGETGRRFMVVVGTQRYHEDVRVVRARLGDDATCRRIDRSDVFSPEL